MRRRRSGRDPLAISLFPFLAVLICTFGVMIVLLVLVVKSADQQMAKTDAAEVKAINQKLQDMRHRLERHQLQVEGFRQLRTDLIEQLQQARSRRAALQSHIDQLVRTARLINHQLEMIGEGDNDSTVVNDDSELERLRRELAREKESLQKRLDDAQSASRPVKYCVVPHDSPDGTRRRPVYIECLEDRFVIQPYGIILRKNDFVEPIVANNPLDAALVAVREYFLENRIEEAGETPYPLLIVRPQGAASYVVARHAIKSWDEEFGYELISADKELTFGSADPLLEKKIRSAVEAAKHRQRQYVASRLLHRQARTKSDSQPEGLQASRRLGGFVSQSGRPASESLTRQSHPDHPESDAAKGADRARSTEPSGDADLAPDIAVNGLKAQAGSLAENRGKNWAVPLRNESSMAYRRPVRIVVDEKGITMPSDSNASRTVRIEFSGRPAESAEQLVDAIWKRIESWGVAGVGGHWQPELIVTVSSSGSRTRYLQLKALLADSGIEIRERTP